MLRIFSKVHANFVEWLGNFHWIVPSLPLIWENNMAAMLACLPTISDLPATFKLIISPGYDVITAFTCSMVLFPEVVKLHNNFWLLNLHSSNLLLETLFILILLRTTNSILQLLLRCFKLFLKMTNLNHRKLCTSMCILNFKDLNIFFHHSQVIYYLCKIWWSG